MEALGHASDEIDIACAGVTKVFRDFWMRPRVRAVENVNLTVRRGEIYGLLGPNGSGKSTTIKMLLGLLQPTAGRIAVLGKRPKDVEIKRQIGYLPEESYLYRFLSGRETLDYYGRLFRLDRRARRERIAMLLDMVGLEAVQDRPVGEYSKGMQRRIGLAQSLINDPQLLILDEPTSGMDPVGARQIKDLIATLAARGKTVLLCSHLLADVEDLCDRVAIMYGGRVRAEGTCDELLEQEHATLLQTGELSEPVLDEVRAVLRRHDQGRAASTDPGKPVYPDRGTGAGRGHPDVGGQQRRHGGGVPRRPRVGGGVHRRGGEQRRGERGRHRPSRQPRETVMR